VSGLTEVCLDVAQTDISIALLNDPRRKVVYDDWTSVRNASWKMTNGIHQRAMTAAAESVLFNFMG